MEQKKILWILFAVTLFFLVVVGAGFIWFYPGAQEQQKEVASTPAPREAAESQEFDPIEWVRSAEEYPGLKKDQQPSTEEDNFVVVYGEDEQQKETEAAAGEGGEPTSETAEEATEDTAEEREKPAKTETRTQPARSDKREESPTARKEVPEKEPAEKEEGKTYQGTRKTIRTVEYWIQAGSYTSKTSAEEVRDTLAKKGFSSRITLKEVEGTRYYRVRIGPYRKKAEADKFLGWVREIKRFEKSYISRVYRQKRVAN
jgi:DedD protein